MDARHVGVLVGAVILGLSLAGCGGDDEETAEATPAAQATATVESSETPTPEATEEESAASGDVTPLGTTLAVGEAAVIDYQDATTRDKGLVELTPESIEKASMDDFKNIDLDEEQKASTPFYARISARNVGDSDLSGSDPATYINGVDDRGQDQNEVIFFGSFESCDNETPKSFKPGESYEACLVYLIPGGGSLEGFHWIQFDEKSGKSDLTWK